MEVTSQVPPANIHPNDIHNMRVRYQLRVILTVEQSGEIIPDL
jgi:hypothetical protein